MENKVTKKTNGLAFSSLVLGILGSITSGWLLGEKYWWGGLGLVVMNGLFSLSSIVTGIISLKKENSAKGVAIAGILLGAFGASSFLWVILILLLQGTW